MTDKELKKLSRAELLEMLLFQTQEVERLKEEVNVLEKQLQERRIEQENAGSIAEAALEINGVFEAAQAAADQYLDGLRTLETKTQERCLEMENKTKDKCKSYVRKARAEAAGFWEMILKQTQDPKVKAECFKQIDMALTGGKSE